MSDLVLNWDPQEESETEDAIASTFATGNPSRGGRRHALPNHGRVSCWSTSSTSGISPGVSVAVA